MAHLKDESFNSRKQIISGMNFFGDDAAAFNVPQSLIKAVSGASKIYKRKLNDQKAEEEALKKRKLLDEEVDDQVQVVKDAAEFAEKEIELAVREAGTIDKSLSDEQKSMDHLLSRMATSKGQNLQDLVKETQLSNKKISSLQESYKKIQGKILSLQMRKMPRKWSPV